MDLLELTNVVSGELFRVKKNSAHRHAPDCERGQRLNTAIHVFRGDTITPEVGLAVEAPHGLGVGVMAAASLFAADNIVITVDGWSRQRRRDEIVTIGISRAGEILWKLQQYERVGSEFLFGAPEVPDKLSEDGEDLTNELAQMMQDNTPVAVPDELFPPRYRHDPEARRAFQDMSAGLGIQRAYRDHINQVQFYGRPGSTRLATLTALDLPVVFT